MYARASWARLKDWIDRAEQVWQFILFLQTLNFEEQIIPNRILDVELNQSSRVPDT